MSFMTTLFSVFAPLLFFFKIKLAVMFFLVLNIFTVFLMMSFFYKSISLSWLQKVSLIAFPSSPNFMVILLAIFLSLMFFNMISLTIYSYPVTTTLSFNIGAALACWLMGVFIQLVKLSMASAVLPSNSPWYLIPFLCLVELISIVVRPITLSFRLLANMTAGHVLIALICKMPSAWILGSLFGVLELMVAVVQGFVFSMLISVYLEEAISH